MRTLTFAVAIVIAVVSGTVPMLVQQTSPAPWQSEPKEPPAYEPLQYNPPPTPTPVPRFQYDPTTPTPAPRFQYDPTTPTPAPRFQYDPTTPTPAPRFQYDPTPTPTPYISPATSVAWINPTTGDVYVGSEVSTRSSMDSFALANELDAGALRQSGLSVHGEVYTIPGAPSDWRSRAGVISVHTARIEGFDGYVVVLSNGPRVSLIGVANNRGGEIDVKAATEYMVGVAQIGIRYRPLGAFVEMPHG